MIGAMTMPAGFKYRDIFIKGKPRHENFDPFRARHPHMDPGRFAKIFSPFDALRGFDECISSKEILYENRRDLDEDALDELNRRLSILHQLTFNSRLARKNRPRVSVTWFVPCQDPNSFAHGTQGQYLTKSGVCFSVGLNALQLDERTIPLCDIIRIDGDLF